MLSVEFSGGEEIEAGGVVTGRLIVRPDAAVKVQGSSVSLQWRTEGRGDKESRAVATVDLGALGELGPMQERSFPFEFRVPEEGPMSYDGKLVRILWEVKAHLDVPWAVDEREAFPVRVIARDG